MYLKIRTDKMFFILFNFTIIMKFIILFFSGVNKLQQTNKITQLTSMETGLSYVFSYSRSFLFGFLEGSLERKPNVKRETKKITTV